MFGSLGAPELLFIFALALLIFGPSKLPELGRTLGKAMSEFRNAANDFKRTLNAEAIEREMRDADPRRAVRDTLADAKKEMDEILKGGGPRAAARDAEPDARDEPTDDAEAEAEPDREPSTVARGSTALPGGETTTDAGDQEPAEKDDATS